MTWHLKDRELEKKLNELVGENQFTEALNRECLSLQSKKNIVVKFGENKGHVKGSFRCYFEKDDLINIGYDPHRWNNFPEVAPLENVWMRLEIFRIDALSQHTYHDAAIFSAGRWRNGESIIEINEGDEVRFRTWDD